MAENDWLKSPVRGPAPITARYGESGPNWTNTHTGLDFAAITGTPVIAVQSGIVMSAGWENSAYGNMVKISHTVAEGKLETRYAHLSVVTVDSGEAVAKGEIIGLVGSTGNTTGPHVHLEVLVDGTHKDPAEYLGTAVDPNPNDIGPQMGLNNPWPDFDLANFGKRAGLFLGGGAVIVVAIMGARKAGAL